MNAKIRAVYLMKIASKYIAENAPHESVFFDEAECDGKCLSEDLMMAAEHLQSEEHLKVPEIPEKKEK